MTDPITAEIIRNYMNTVALEVYESLCRASPNPGFNEAKDAGAGVYYYDGEEVSIVARAGISLHSYAGLTSVKECLDFFHGDLENGDVLLVSDPYYGGSHIPDYTIVKPVFYDGKPAFFPAVRGHMMDAGGTVPGNANFGSREIWHDGFRFAPLKLCEKGERRREVWNWVLANSRLPALLEADLEAMIGSCAVGEARVRALCRKYGLDTVRGSLDWIFDYSERKFRDQVRRWPDGKYVGEARLDTDFAGRTDLPIKVTVTISGDSIEFDFAGTASQSEGIINSVAANTTSYIVIAFSALCPDIPINSGMFRAIDVKLPPGTIVNPNPPAPAAFGTVCCGGQIGTALMKACEQFAPQQASNISIDIAGAWTFGLDERPSRFTTQSAGSGKYFIHYDSFSQAMSSGAAFGVDGWGGWATPFSAALMPTVEVTELQYPVLYRQVEYATDSAAPGRWRGSPALFTRRESCGASALRVNLCTQALIHPLAGYAGGADGVGNYMTVEYGDDKEEVVNDNPVSKAVGDRLTVCALSGGAGGWGHPLERDPAAVLNDVLDGYVSLEGARHDYGVVIDPKNLELMSDATRKQREAMRKVVATGTPWRALGREQTVSRAGIASRVEASSRRGDS